jgi:prolyl oligopeptidase
MLRVDILIVIALGVIVPPVAGQIQATPRGVTIDTLGSTLVPDPYRWLEDMQSLKTVAWMRAQDAAARRRLSSAKGRTQLRDSIARAATAQTYGAPVNEGGRYFYTIFPATGPTRDVSIMMRDSATGRETLVLPADSLKAATHRGPRRAIPDPSGNLVAYGLASETSEWETIRVRDVRAGQDLPDSVTGFYRYSGLSWARVGAPGFFYTRYPLPADDHDLTGSVTGGAIYFHRLGTAQRADRRIYASPDSAAWALSPTVSDEGRYLIITAVKGVGRNTRLFIVDLSQSPGEVRLLAGGGDANYAYVGVDGTRVLVQTDLDAPRGRVIAIDADASEPARWTELVPQGPDAIDAWIGSSAVGDRLLIAYRKNAILTAKLFDRGGRFLQEVELPGLGSIWTGFSGKMGNPEALYTLQGVADPGTIYRMDVRTGGSSVFLKPSLPYETSRFVTEQVAATSRDGTRVPMYVVHRSDVPIDGQAPAWIYGYGSQSWTASPWFQPLIAQWLLAGGVWAVPNLRGGGEFGEAWHRAGTRRNKQNGIDDYLAAADWLVRHRYTSRDRLVAHTSSAGGVLVAAALVQRPGLFAAAVLEYPVIDVLRYDRFSAGSRWTDEYGVSSDSGDLAAMLQYAPLQNIHRGKCYPATLVTPGERDQTAAPMHAFKFVAALQAAQGCNRPVLLRVTWGGGHTAGATVPDAVENWTDQLRFVRATIARTKLRDALRQRAPHLADDPPTAGGIGSHQDQVGRLAGLSHYFSTRKVPPQIPTERSGAANVGEPSGALDLDDPPVERGNPGVCPIGGPPIGLDGGQSRDRLRPGRQQDRVGPEYAQDGRGIVAKPALHKRRVERPNRGPIVCSEGHGAPGVSWRAAREQTGRQKGQEHSKTV